MAADVHERTGRSHAVAHRCSSVDSMTHARPPPRPGASTWSPTGTQTDGRPLLDVVEAALRGGVGAVQLRERDLTDARAARRWPRALRALTRAARRGAADQRPHRRGAGLRRRRRAPARPTRSRSRDARALLGPRRLIGVSTHHPPRWRPPPRAGADFAVFGPDLRHAVEARLRPAARARRARRGAPPPRRCRCSPSAASTPTTPPPSRAARRRRRRRHPRRARRRRSGAAPPPTYWRPSPGRSNPEATSTPAASSGELKGPPVGGPWTRNARPIVASIWCSTRRDRAQRRGDSLLARQTTARDRLRPPPRPLVVRRRRVQVVERRVRAAVAVGVPRCLPARPQPRRRRGCAAPLRPPHRGAPRALRRLRRPSGGDRRRRARHRLSPVIRPARRIRPPPATRPPPPRARPASSARRRVRARGSPRAAAATNAGVQVDQLRAAPRRRSRASACAARTPYGDARRALELAVRCGT